MVTITVAVLYGTSKLLDPLVLSVASRNGLDPQKWSTVAAIIFNIGSLAAYISAGFIAEALGRRKYMALTFLGGLITTPLAFAWRHSLPALMVASLVLGLPLALFPVCRSIFRSSSEPPSEPQLAVLCSTLIVSWPSPCPPTPLH